MNVWSRFVSLTTLCGLLVPFGAGAQDGMSCPEQAERGWNRSEQLAGVPPDRSREEVRQELLARARRAVVDEASGIRIAGARVRSQSETMTGGRSTDYSDLYLEMFSQTTEGRIVEERAPCLIRIGADSLRLVLFARVQSETESVAVGFDASVTTNQPAYRDGDPIEVTVRVSQSARVYLFSVTPDGAATLFFPNRYDTLNVVAPEQVRHVPARGGAPYTLVAELNPRLGTKHAEMVLAVFYRGDAGQPFAVRDAFARGFTLAEINRALLAVPRRERTEAMTGYEIRGAEVRP